MKPGDDVWVDFDGHEWPGSIEKVESMGMVRCRVHIDPEWDFGRGGASVMPEQTVAVRSTHVRAREAVREHTYYVCDAQHEDGGWSCPHCAGGLQSCTVCGCGEGDLAPQCPGSKVYE